MKTLCASWITKWTCKEINQCKKELLFKKFHFLQYVNWGGIKFDWLVFLRAIQRLWGQNYSRTVCSWSSNQALVMEAFSFHSVEWALLHVIHTHSCRCKQTSSTAKSLPFIPQLSYCAWRAVDCPSACFPEFWEAPHWWRQSDHWMGALLANVLSLFSHLSALTSLPPQPSRTLKH